MKRYFIEEAKCGVSEGGIACGPVGGSVVTTVKFNDGEKTGWLSLVEVEGIPNFLLSDRDIHEDLIEEDYDDKEFWDYTLEINIGEFDGIELGEYEDIFASFADNPENPAVPLVRYMITLTRCPMEEATELLALVKGKFIDEVDIPMSEDEEEYLAELDEEE